MSIPVEVSLQAIQSELAATDQYAAAAGLLLDTNTLAQSNLRFHVRFENRDSEKFYVEFECADYPLYPPTVEFVSQDRSQRGTAYLYPKGFHPMPCICMRYNRKAYQERGGPHSDWRLLDWRLPTGNGIGIDTLTLIVSDLHSKILQSSGRMA